VPERDLHRVFDSVEGCFLAAFDEGVARLSAIVAEAVAAVGRDGGWLQRVRAGLVALLGFLDDEPGWGRLLIVEAPTMAGAGVPERRRRLFGVLSELLSEGCEQEIPGAEPAPSLRLKGELVVGGVFSVVHARMIEGDGRASEGDGGPLVELAPSLMSFVVVSYLGHAAASSELDGSSGSGRPICDREGSSRGSEAPSRGSEPPVRTTYRTTRVLRAIASMPRSSNREIAQAAGLADEGQTSKLLSRLERRGVIENAGLGAAYGEPNAWLLTPYGRRVVEAIGEGFAPGAPLARASRRVRGAA